MPWGIYKNGNSIVKINLSDGSKIRETQDDDFDLEFPETLDVACTSFCDGGCSFCYANCSTNGTHADIMNVKFIDTIRPYTEMALQLNDLSHPQLVPFLEKLKRKRILANITVNQIHFERKQKLIKELVDRGLIKGIGISLRKPTPEFIEMVKQYPNAVIHCINGILSAQDIEAMRGNDLKILILGYKDLGRGVVYKEQNGINIKAKQKYLYDILPTLPYHFKLVSFDNLAIEQLDVKRILTQEQWEEFYMGDEGTASMFVDLVTGKFGISSLCHEEDMHPIMDDIKDMFEVVKKMSKSYKK